VPRCLRGEQAASAQGICLERMRFSIVRALPATAGQRQSGRPIQLSYRQIGETSALNTTLECEAIAKLVWAPQRWIVRPSWAVERAAGCRGITQMSDHGVEVLDRVAETLRQSYSVWPSVGGSQQIGGFKKHQVIWQLPIAIANSL